MADEETTIWSRMKPSSFEISGYPKIILPTWNKIDGDHGIREVPRSVPWVNGEQLDETGTRAKIWSTEHPFINDLCEFEEGIGKDPPLYPDRLELFEKILEERKTGTLNLPWRRNIRCKGITWRRSASTDMQDCEVLTVTWKEDNENKLENPSSGSGVRANLNYAIEQAQFEAERAGVWDGSWEDITTFAAQLEAVIAAPGVFLQDVAHKANRVVRACDSIIASFTRREAGRDILNNPIGHFAFRGLFSIRELASRAEAEARGEQKRIVTRPAPFTGTLWRIAMQWDADAEEMLELNPQIPDPNEIRKGTRLRVAL